MFDVNSIAEVELQKGGGQAFAATSGGKQKIKFIRGCVIDPEKSAVGGTYTDIGHPRQGEYKAPVFKDAIMVVFVDPDPPHDEVAREATREDFARYAVQWEQSKKVIDLSPVHYLPGMTPALHEMCKARGIFWVEQIAQKEDLCPELKPFALTAQQFLMIAKGQKPHVRLSSALTA